MTANKKHSGLSTGDFYTEGNSLLLDAVSELAVKVNTYKKKHDKKSVLFTGCGGAVGTTMIAVNLAVAFSRSGSRTLLIDADLRKGSALDNGLRDFFRGKTELGGVIRQSNLLNLDFAPSGARIESPALMLCSDRMSEFLKQANNKYEYIIVNSPPVTVFPDAAALFTDVDGIVLVCSLNETTKKQIERAREAVSPYADKYYGMVVNSMIEKQYRKLYTRRDISRRGGQL